MNDLEATILLKEKTVTTIPDGTRLTEIRIQLERSFWDCYMEEDAVMFSPTEAFSKWATEIVKRQALMHLPEGQRDFLSRMALNAT